MEMTHTRQFLLTPPQDLPQAQPWGLPLVYLSGQLGPTGQFTAAPLPPEVRGGLLLVGVSEAPQPGADPKHAAQAILTLCRARRFGGAVLDVDCPPTPYLARLIRLLDEGLSPSGGWLYLPEAYGAYSKRALLYCTAAVSGGSLRHRLEELIARWGKPARPLSPPHAGGFLSPRAHRLWKTPDPGGAGSASAAVRAKCILLP